MATGPNNLVDKFQGESTSGRGRKQDKERENKKGDYERAREGREGDQSSEFRDKKISEELYLDKKWRETRAPMDLKASLLVLLDYQSKVHEDIWTLLRGKTQNCLSLASRDQIKPRALQSEKS